MRRLVFRSLAACALAAASISPPLAAEPTDKKDPAPEAGPAASGPANAVEKPADAVSPDLVIGDWLGTLDAGGQILHLALHVTKGEGGALKATLDSLDQGAMGIGVQTVTLVGDSLTLDLTIMGARFEGKVAKDEIAGTWTQGGGSLPLKLTRGVAKPPASATALPSDPIKPLWMGTVDAGGAKLRLVVHLERGADGVLTSTLDSLDQGANGLKFESAVFKDGKLTLEMKAMGARFEGTANKEGTEVTGQWMQGGASLPLVLKPIDKVPVSQRPQEPKGPLPYAEEEITIKSAPSGVTLACTLTTPKSGAPFPGVVLITGSGPEDRNETVFGHRPFLVLADHLTRRGIAVLRCDDRGVGGSSPGPPDATSESFADDALAGVAFLKTRREIDPARIGLVGHSEGGIIGPAAAVRSKDVAFLVMLASPGMPGADIILAQSALIMKAEGTPQADIDRMTAVSARVFAALKEEKDLAIAEARVRKELAASPEPLTPAMLDQRVTRIFSPWFRYFIAYDPRPTLGKVQVPVLSLIGERDLQVPAKDNTDAIRAALAGGSNKDHTVLVLPGLNHLFQEAKTGSPSEYASIEQTFAPSALTTISDWILARANRTASTGAPAESTQTR